MVYLHNMELKTRIGLTESENGIFNAILRGHIDFTSDPWPSISPAAKDLVRKMLHSDPKQRLTAYQVLSKYIYQLIFFKNCLNSFTFHDLQNYFYFSPHRLISAILMMHYLC